MNDSVASSHPLNIARTGNALVSHAVSVLNHALKHIGYCFDASMRMPRESSHIVFRVVRMEIVKKQKWVQLRNLLRAKGPLKLHACTFKSCLAT